MIMGNINLDNWISEIASGNKLKEKFGLSYNPFPRSGIAIIEDSDETMCKLAPVNEEIQKLIFEYIKDALTPAGENNELQYLSLIVKGEYGSGKTQTLMFIKSVLQTLNIGDIKPYVVYIDNPGQKLSELIGNVVEQIGVENFRRYLWNIFIDYIHGEGKAYEGKSKEEVTRISASVKNDLLNPQSAISLGLFSSVPDNNEENEDFFEKDFLNYKSFLDSLLLRTQSSARRTVTSKLKSHMINCFSSIFNSNSVAEYFFDIVSDNLGVNKSWDIITSGSAAELNKREVYILKAIVEIVKQQMGRNSFIILVDEFEEITTDRKKPSDIDNYLRNLRSLIDREKNWCSVFAMNQRAFEDIKTYSPPLAARIDDRVVNLKPLDSNSCKTMVSNYLSLARVNEDEYSISPFDDSGIDALLSPKDIQLKGSPRFIIKNCYTLLQRAGEELDPGDVINAEFVKNHLSEVIK